MTKEQVQQEIFKDKADTCGFDFVHELREILIGGVTYEDMICNPNSVVIDEAYTKSILEDILISVLRLMDKSKLTHVYIMNFSKIIKLSTLYNHDYAIVISNPVDVDKDIKTIFIDNKSIEIGSYTFLGFELQYFIVKSDKFGDAIIYSSANGFTHDIDIPFSVSYMKIMYDKYVNSVLITEKHVRRNKWSYSQFIDYINNEDYDDGIAYSVPYLEMNIRKAANQYTKGIIQSENECYEERKKKREKRAEEDRLEKERILSILSSYGKFLKNNNTIRTNYTLSNLQSKTQSTNKSMQISNAAESNINQCSRDKIDIEKLSKDDRKLLSMFPNVKYVKEFNHLKEMRKEFYPFKFSNVVTFLGLLSSKTNDNFTDSPNIFSISFGIVSWVSEDEIISLLENEDIYDIILEYTFGICIPSYMMFRRYLLKDLLYISNINVYNRTLTILMGMKGDNYEF